MKKHGFCLKWKFLWVAWIVEEDEEPRISYFSMSLTMKSALKKMEKFAVKRYKEEENGVSF